MSNLLSSLLTTTESLRAFDRTLEVIQNNVANANTPGYVKQEQSLVAQPFDAADGLPGGVLAGPVISARSEFLEQGVRRQQELLGQFAQQTENLSQIEPQFDLSSNFGIPHALNKVFGSFAQLSVNPNDAVSRQSVIDRAKEVAQAFNQQAASLNAASQNVDRKTRDTVENINRLAARIADINAHLRNNAQSQQDPGLDAQLHTTLEELAELADFTLLQQPDGTVSVYLGGQTPLVIGDHQFQLAADFSSPQTAILDAQDNDVTSQIQRGRLGALIDEKNRRLPSYKADLDTLAQTLADTVNGALAGGVDKNGTTPAVSLFTYNAAAGAASTLAVSGITPDQIAAAAPTAPGGNSNAIALARLADTPAVNGLTFTGFYGSLGARVGRALATAREKQDIQKQLVAQARALRADASGVSLDEEAAHLIQIQRSYQAAGKLVGVLDELTVTLINLIK